MGVASAIYVVAWWVVLTSLLVLRGRGIRHREVRWARNRDLKKADLTVSEPGPAA